MNADEEKIRYQSSWGFHANHYAPQGCYDWMSEQLDTVKPKRILDIGCGTGEGLAALRNRFQCQILSIEENPYCIGAAAKLLRSQGAKVQTARRYQYVEMPDGRHGIGIEPGGITLSREVMLLQGDIILEDDALFAFIRSKAPFDAVTVWLIGAVNSRRSCVNLDPLRMEDTGSYRLHVQNRVYRLAGTVLRSGGILQVVDRGEEPDTDNLREDVLRGHREQAAVSDLVVEGLKFRLYDEVSGERGIQMAQTVGTSGRKPTNYVLGMVSTLSRKP